ncbi:LysM peptidoglycan-binding domain-containing protein [Lapidilactobacillus gannanensis]|jgi:LysM repeat protein|uniref:LysM peptidoglycan-binding domain-containing protein n=1 Tax=Lapidilactobacillus gannanensis TaxID=2486002 RepID=A0ABW4BPC8_9LACO|nr:LysM domain-containing protein [Lapidilactobacillus gannanensis]MCH4057391.1 LysM peptidoglycan-binding domain-containing protein [Lactobacillaceae bacterium]
MSQKDQKNSQNNDQQARPWENTFDSDRDENGKLSRVATKKKERNNIVFVSILVVILLAVIGSTIWMWVAAQNDNKSPQIVVSSSSRVKSSVKSQKSETKKSSTKSSSSVSEEASSSSVSSTEESSTEQSASEPVTESSSSTAASSSTAETGSTYTVKSGDNLYRIAVNNGLTLDQLLSLNGLTSSSAIAPGQQLRIK